MLSAIIRRLCGEPAHPFVVNLHPEPTAPVPVAKPKRHHEFRLYSRNQWMGMTTYKCRCGAWYVNGHSGWELREYDHHHGACRRIK